MVRPNFIPRTLIGVGGVRLFNIPGVIYPEEMLKRHAGVKKKDGKPFHSVPSWGITTKEAARILGCSPSAARVTLHKNKVHYRIVSSEQSRRLYWRKSQVEKIRNDRLPEMREENHKLVNSQEAVKILGVARSSLQRYVQRGKLRAINVRYVIPNGGGARHRTYYERAAVLKLAYRLEAMRRHAAELDRLLSECDRRFEEEQQGEE